MKRDIQTWTTAAMALAAALLATSAGCSDPVTQPIQFNHEKHTADLECVDCHKFNRTQTFSGLPTVKDCMECHDKPQTDSPEEEKIRVAAKEGRELEWKRLFQVPKHVYYSHRRHVILGQLPCQRCHGNMGKMKAPPTTAPVAITMSFCIDCHKERNVPVDCVTCHR